MGGALGRCLRDTYSVPDFYSNSKIILKKVVESAVPNSLFPPRALIEPFSIFKVIVGTHGLQTRASLTDRGEAGREDPQPSLSEATSALPRRG